MATITRPWMGTNRSEKTLASAGYDSEVERFPAMGSDIEQPVRSSVRESNGLLLNRGSTAMDMSSIRRGSSPEMPVRPGSSGGRGAAARALSGGGGPGMGGGPPGMKPPGMGPPDDKFDPKSAKFWIIMVSNFIAIFLVAIDRTILATAIPQITNDFNSQADIGWYAAGYMLTGAASQLFFGRVYKFYDLKWTFLTCIGIFELGSVICAVSQSSVVFILGRAVAGLGSAGIFTGAMMIMIPMVPLPKRPLFQSMFGMIFGVSSVAGPLLGGVFADKLTWRWCFWINLPMGAVSVAVVFFMLKLPSRPKQPVPIKQHILRLDPLGTLFLIPSVSSLLLALQWGGTKFEWASWPIILMFGLFGALFAAFVVVQGLMPKTATVPFRIIGQRSIFYAAFFNFCLTGSQLITIYFIPIWFQSVKGVTPIQSGIYTIPFVASTVVSSIMSGIFTTKIGYYIPSMIITPCIMAVGAGLMSTFEADTPTAKWVGYQFIAGFGLGFGVQVSNLCAQTILPKEDVSMGVSIMFFAQMLGGAVFTSLGQSLLSNALVERLSAIGDLGTEGILDVGATEVIKYVQENFPDSVGLVIEGYNYACTQIFFTAMIIAFVTLSTTFGMEWRSVKKQGGPPGGGPPGSKPSSKEKNQAIMLEDRSPVQDPESQSGVAYNRYSHVPSNRDSQFSIPRKPLPPAYNDSQGDLGSPLDPPAPGYMREPGGNSRPSSVASRDSRRSSVGSNKLRKKSIMRENFQ
ncbi:uncharacterized protein MKZ38_003193 [Zalerion maritima]|uniref:Major facilitator superfamily (MFS) profile domain-containing protein n=1 Tax=Zalerion maritima TaxID=339359 RepID=A0AAD5S0X9_9PEZI|nr:uncharacterized protein MKZ38_003193 [Zalerion maritima]